jgi:hypothetical protein
MRTLIALAAVALLTTGCLTTGDVTTAQQQYLASLQAQQQAEREHSRELIQALAGFAASPEPLVQAMAIAGIDRIAAARSATATASAAAAQGRMPDGPITTVLKVALPYVLPLAQIWQADRAGARSLETAALNTGLIGNIVGQISRDPLVVQAPAPEIVQIPTMVVDRDVPLIVEQPVIVGAP